MRFDSFQIIWTQVFITVVGAFILYFAVHTFAAKALMYGGIITIISTVFMTWRFRQGENQKNMSPEWALRQAYKTAVERFIWALVMLVVGFKFLELPPIWILAGFVVGQAAWLLLPIWIKLRTL